ncbi:hypothetical protein BRAS3843_360022 [Bradyrhizobium sp. STM 3843]|nr:hypothetical protein BRAS3843_360022 [Bradyrhizobium sp. STM 3843]
MFADEAAYQQQVHRHLFGNSSAFPQPLQDRSLDIDLTVTLDRNGKLLSVDVDRSSGSSEDNDNVVTGLRRIQPFPPVPGDVQVPYKIKLPLTFAPTRNVAFINLKGSKAASPSEKEIAFRGEILKRLYSYDHRPVLPDNIEKPADARPTVVFSIDRDGKLLDAAVTKSFGLKMVDDNALNWLKKAGPFPSIPPELKAPMKLTAEIVFGPPTFSDDARIKKLINGVCRGC